MSNQKSNFQNNNLLNRTNSVIYWPILRRLPFDFLKEVKSFKIFNNGKSAILIHKDGVYAFGDNSFKWLGVGGDKNQIDPAEKIDNFNPDHIENIAIGTNFVLILATGGELFGCGNNSDGQVPNYANQSSVDHFTLSKKYIKQVACGSRHVLALDFKGMVWTWGNNQHHQCLECLEQKIIEPDFVARSYFRGNRIVEIACGYESSIALDQRAGLYVWGYLSSIYFERPTLIRIPMEERDCIKSIHGTFDACVAVSHFGKVFQCYQQNNRLCFQPIQPQALGPIELVITQWYNNQLIMNSKDKKFFLWSKENQTPIEAGLSSTIPDVSNLYCDPNTPGLTQLPICMDKDEIQTTFNDPTRCDLKIIFNQALLPRTIYIQNSSINQNLSYILSKLGCDLSNNQDIEELMILNEKYSYAVCFRVLNILYQYQNLNSSINHSGKRNWSVYGGFKQLLKEKLSAEDLIELYSISKLIKDNESKTFQINLDRLIVNNFKLQIGDQNFIKLHSIIRRFPKNNYLRHIITEKFIDPLQKDLKNFDYQLKCLEDSLHYDSIWLNNILATNLVGMCSFHNRFLFSDRVEAIFEQDRHFQTTILKDNGRLKQLATDYDPEQKNYLKFIKNHSELLVLIEIYTMTKNYQFRGFLKYVVDLILLGYVRDFWILFYFYELSLKNDPQDSMQFNSILGTPIRSLILDHQKIREKIVDFNDLSNVHQNWYIRETWLYIKSNLIKSDKEFQELSFNYDLDSSPEDLLAFIYFQFYDLAQRNKDFKLVYRLKKIICEEFIEPDLLHFLPVVYMLSLYYKDWNFVVEIHNIIMKHLNNDNMFQIFNVLNKYEPDDKFLDEFCKEMSKHLNEFNIIILFERINDKQTRAKFQEYFAEQLPKYLSNLNCGKFYQSFIDYTDFRLLRIVQRFMIEKMDPKCLLEFYRLAIQNQDKKLLTDIREVVQKNVDAKNICGLLQLALKESDQETFKLCFQAIQSNINASNCFQLYKLSHDYDQDVSWKNLRPTIALYLVKNIKPNQILEVYCLAAKSHDELIMKHLRKSSPTLIKYLNPTNLEQVYQSALNANDETLLKAIETSMKNYLTTNNFMKIYELAFKHQDYTIRQVVARFWSQKRKQIHSPFQMEMDIFMYEQLKSDANIESLLEC